MGRACCRHRIARRADRTVAPVRPSAMPAFHISRVGGDRRNIVAPGSTAQDGAARQRTPGLAAAAAAAVPDRAAYFAPRFASPAAGMRSQAAEPVNSLHVEQDPIHRPMIDRFREREVCRRADATRPARQSDLPKVKSNMADWRCPARSTEVATSIDLTTEALAAGFTPMASTPRCGFARTRGRGTARPSRKH